MRALPSVLFCVCLVLQSAPAQQGKVIVANTESKELKRTAYRLRLPVERLKNVRRALQEATELAKRVRPAQGSIFGPLANFWITFHRSRAESSIKDLISALRSAAQDAREPREYTDATSVARQLFADLARLDPDEALNLAQKWPEPSKSLGETARAMRAVMEDRFRCEAAQRIGYDNPDAALKLWSDIGNARSVDPSARAQLADALAHSGRKDAALKLIDQAISDLGTAGPYPIAASDSAQLIQTVSALAPDRLPEVFKLLTTSAASLPAGGLPSLKVGEQVIALDNTEALAINLLTELQQRPGLTMKVLDAMPDLKSKLEVVGGIDGVLTGGPVEIGYVDQGVPRSKTYYGPEAEYGDRSLYSELRGNSVSDPGFVADRLAKLGSSPEEIQSLLNLAQNAAFEDSDLSSKALETARKLIRRAEPVGTRARLFAQMVGTSRRCDGETDPEILKDGFLLVAELREKEKEQTGGTLRVPGRSDADMLERALISELALDDFDAAIRYVRTMPDEQVRLSTLLAVISACRRPF